MKKLNTALLFGSSIMMASLDAHASMSVGAKIGANYSNGKYSEKAAEIIDNPAKFSGGKGKSHMDITAFATRRFFEDDLLWIDGELDLSAFGSRFTSDTNAKKRYDTTTGEVPINDIKVKERFSGALVANVGKDLNDDYSVYGKFGLTLSSFKIDTEYDPNSTSDTIPSIKETQKSYVLGGLIGAGVKRAVSDNVSLIIEAAYNFTSSKKIKDFNPVYNGNKTQNFSERTVRLDKASLNFGINVNI